MLKLNQSWGVKNKPPDVGAIVEQWGPYIWAIVITALLIFLDGKGINLTNSSLVSLLPNIINVLGVALAFIVTVQGVVMGIFSKDFTLRLKELGVYDVLVGYFRAATFFCLVGLLLSCVFLGVDLDSSFLKEYCMCLKAVWLFIVLCAAFTTYRVGMLFNKILKLNIGR